MVSKRVDSDREEEFQIPAVRNEPGFVQIPTTDPQAALNFCQALAKSLTIHSNQGFITQSDSETEFLKLRPAISVVIPVFNEEDNLPLLYKRLTDVLGNFEPLYELIFVDDGSRDSGVQILEELAEVDPKVIVVQLARNFG
ncbi:MAG: glycosyltransferase, partial [Anaerolineales bacterium]|nr:glycosyltransferase [Anaerolineales bacterium]